MFLSVQTCALCSGAPFQWNIFEANFGFAFCMQKCFVVWKFMVSRLSSFFFVGGGGTCKREPQANQDQGPCQWEWNKTDWQKLFSWLMIYFVQKWCLKVRAVSAIILCLAFCACDMSWARPVCVAKVYMTSWAHLLQLFISTEWTNGSLSWGAATWS